MLQQGREDRPDVLNLIAAHAVGRADVVFGTKSGRARWKSASRPGFLLAMAMPAGLRSHTPMNQTASKPRAAMASHSGAGTEAGVTGFPSCGSIRQARPTC